MQVYVKIKKIGKRRNVLEPVPYVIPDSVHSLRQLITTIVESEVEQYNQTGTDVQLILYLTSEEIDAQADAGKGSFGRLCSEKKAYKAKAVENAIQCFEDGLVRVFINDEELTDLDSELVVEEGAVFTFMRLTFLAGRMW